MPKLLDVLRTNKEIRRLIVEKATKYRLPLRMLSEYAGIEYKLFLSEYINPIDSVNTEITEEQFEKMLNLLGVEIRFQFVTNTSRDIETEIRDFVRKRQDHEDIVNRSKALNARR